MSVIDQWVSFDVIGPTAPGVSKVTATMKCELSVAVFHGSCIEPCQLEDAIGNARRSLEEKFFPTREEIRTALRSLTKKYPEDKDLILLINNLNGHFY
jgi:hypothetical protein